MPEPLLNWILTAMTDECESASKKFHAFHSMHEGYAVMAEELDELWDGVKRNDAELAIREAVQVGAMAIRFILNISALASKDGRL
jgi:hypothetical protein